ncbi:uncharacterized protein [Henckelia pumila]|uniref:uncharacterized protein n=1 Tax=Henckelia pumila TaxID=405737 RepID=UPI003C6DE78F
MDLDLAIRVDRPPALTDKSTSDDKREFEKWERSNRMCLMIMKKAIPKTFRDTMSSDITTAKDFLTDIEKRFVKNEKAEIGTLLANRISMRYKGKGNIREFIMEMSHLASKLKALKLEVFEDLQVHLVLLSLPQHFNQFKEEERLKQDKTENAHFASTSKTKDKGNKNKGKEAVVTQPLKKQKKDPSDSQSTACFFCGGEGHMKRHYSNYHAWRANKVPRHMWWIDSDATTHISVSMRGCLDCRKPNDAERFIYVGDDNKVQVEAIGKFRLLLKTGIYLDLFETFSVPSFRRNLVSISALEKSGFSCSFGNGIFSLFRDSNLVGSDDFSRYGFIYLIHEKAQSLDVFKNYKAEVENQLGLKIKTVRSDRGGEYYGRYDGSGEQRPGPFAKFLEECGIIPQYTIPGSPTMNGVAERRNKTLKDMVRSMISHSTLPESLWGEELKTAAYILNRGCPAEARPYKPNEKKLDLRTVSCYFIGYSERSRGTSFMIPQLSQFLSREMPGSLRMPSLRGGYKVRDIVFEEEYVNIPTGVLVIDQDIISDLAKDTIQDNIGDPPIQDNIQDEQTQAPQEPMPLRRSTRERRNAVPND